MNDDMNIHSTPLPHREGQGESLPPILEIGGILVSSEILTEYFCCDYEKCKGICCVEGSDGAPVTMDEIADIEDMLDDVWPMLSASAQSVIDQQGVAYSDRDGDLVTSIVRGKECVFAREENGCWLCMLEKRAREKQSSDVQRPTFIKPISCALYPIREKNFGIVPSVAENGSERPLIALNYHRWGVCRDAVEKGKALGLPVYKFLKEPLIRRFGESWYQELCNVADQLLRP